MIKILLVDDHQLFLDGIGSIFENNKEIVVSGVVNSGQAALDFLEQSSVDVVVLDINMPPGMNGIETMKEIKVKFPAIKVLILSMHKEGKYIRELFNMGAHGYILKDKSKEELEHAIYKVREGGPYYNLELLSIMQNVPELPENPLDQLSSREKEVLTLIGMGLTSKDVGKELFIHPTTVDTHRRNLLQKLDVSNDKYLVRIAIKYGLVEL